MNALLDKPAYHMRLTINAEMDTIKQFIETLTDTYIICSEVTHYHIFVITSTHSCDFLKEQIKSKLNLHGNKGFSCLPSRNKRQLQKYILKDGFFIYKGIDDAVISRLHKSSVKKYGEEFETKLGLVEEMYFKGRKDERNFLNFCANYIMLRAEYGLVRRNDIGGYVNRMRIKHEGLGGAHRMAEEWFGARNY